MPVTRVRDERYKEVEGAPRLNRTSTAVRTITILLHRHSLNAFHRFTITTTSANMQTKLFSVLAVAAGFTSITSAAPLESRQVSCSAYPWFIGPHYSSDCSGTPPAYQPTSGPIASTPSNVTCGTLYNPNGAPQAFASVAINRDSCPQQVWTVKLYADADCKTAPTVVNSDICVPAPAGSAGWLKFDALYFPGH